MGCEAGLRGAQAHGYPDILQGRFAFGGWVGRSSRQPHNVTVTAAGHTPVHVKAQLTPTVTTEVNVRLEC